MLEPRETDIPALFLILVVLPLVTYIFLGRWNEAAKKKERVSLLAQRAAEEALKAETMAAASVIPLVPVPSSVIHQCARCHSPATTRCSQCKSVRYCSGKCQILHWRQVHNLECHLLGNNCNSSFSKPGLTDEFLGRVSFDGYVEAQYTDYNIKKSRIKKALPDGVIETHVITSATPPAPSLSMDASVGEIRSVDKRVSQKGNRDILRRGEETMCESSELASRSRVTNSTSCCTISSTELSMKQKSRGSDSMLSEHDSVLGGMNSGHAGVTSTMGEYHLLQKQREHISESRNHRRKSNSFNTEGHEMSACTNQKELIDEESLVRDGITSDASPVQLNCASGKTSARRSNRAKSASHSHGTKSHKPTPNISREQMCSSWEGKGQNIDDPKNARRKDGVPPQAGSGVANLGIMRMFGQVKSSKFDRQEYSEPRADKHKKLKMVFPYEEFVKFFEYEDFTLSPRGLMNCGNSCYANAVLQCLTCTKPLMIYLLRRSHSRTPCGRDWCLMCELEQHVMMLRESGGPLTPSRILLQMGSINGQIGNGSQEDAHEFLRLLVASMQSICLEALGGENAVDPRLHETTFIQHTFGGRLRSKVKCLRCHHESECSENIMDLSLEIFGWVNSLEDALTQFTSPEDLDGENMYRCGRCASYVRALKQLSIQEAPNILTIVLKRFQEGSYGKINKCITFPDMLDMIPFMTGTDDMPPLYMLYGVVVHLDMLNASFSGHYISYVKDLLGNWFRIDDTQIQPVSMSQVMSEGAYILFYKRSSPRPIRKNSRKQAPGNLKHCPPKSTKASKPEQTKPDHVFVGVDSYTNHRMEVDRDIVGYTSGGFLRNANKNRPPIMGTYAEFSDATSSDWSLFTSSDEASFTTESTRDSFSTVDHADPNAVDPFSSIINSLCASEYSTNRTVACSMFSSSKPQTRFFSERKGSVQDSCVPARPLDRVQGARIPKQVTVPSPEGFYNDSSIDVHVKYGREPRCGPHQTSL